MKRSINYSGFLKLGLCSLPLMTACTGGDTSNNSSEVSESSSLQSISSSSQSSSSIAITSSSLLVSSSSLLSSSSSSAESQSSSAIADELLTPTPTPVTAPPSDGSTIATLEPGSIGDNDSVPPVNCSQTVNSLSALESAADSLAPGDTLCLADGTYNGSLDLSLSATGTESNRITIAAANPGSAIITGGEVTIAMSGDYLTLQGFVFRDGLSGSYITLKGSAKDCFHCRITEISMIDMNGGDGALSSSSKWIQIYGQYNRIDHSWFSGKTDRGAWIVMPRDRDTWVADPSSLPPEYAMIDHNYFGDRAPSAGKAYAGSSDNEYEGVRLGLSFTHSAPSHSVVEYNYFERIQGEAEVISNKSGNNIIRHNTVRDSNGSIVSRHGKAATIAGNFILGDGHPYSGGIRVVDSDHIVTNNYIEGARYKSSNWNGGIVLTGGNGSGPTDNGYQNVDNVLVAHNTIVDSVNSLNVYGGNQSTAPSNIYFLNNIIDDALGPVIRTNGQSMPSGSTFAGNYIHGQRFSDQDSLTSQTGLSYQDARLYPGSDNLMRPNANSPSLTADNSANTGNFVLPTSDMDGQARSGSNIAGADAPVSNNANIGILSAKMVGPKSYRPVPGKQYVQKVLIENYDFDSGDLTGWINNGAQVSTQVDHVFSRGASLFVSGGDSKASQTLSVTPNTHYTLTAFTQGLAQILVEGGGEAHSIIDDNSNFGLTALYFNSGSASEVTLTASVAGSVDLQSVADSSLTDYRASGGSNSVWTTVEGDNDGNVGTSSNTASGSDGSATLGYTKPSHVGTSPSLSQTLDIPSDTQLAFSIAMLVKASQGSTASATVRIDGDQSTILADTLLDYDQLNAAGLSDGFKQFSQNVQTGNNTQATITVSFNPQALSGEATLDTDPAKEGQYISATRDANALRIDDISLISKGAPPAGVTAGFDSFRLVSHALSPVESAVVQP